MSSTLASVKVITLCENSVNSRGLLGEHGLALLLESRDKKILFDTGPGLALLSNAKALRIELRDLDAVVLSHGHYDHTGGLKSLLEVDFQRPLPVYAHPDIFEDKYRVDSRDSHRYIGVPWSQERKAEIKSHKNLTDYHI